MPPACLKSTGAKNWQAGGLPHGYGTRSVPATLAIAPGRARFRPGAIPLVPETPERRKAAPALSHELHREAPTGAVDPVTAGPAGSMLLPRREGSVEFPQTRH
jgi:hypothetical protein